MEMNATKRTDIYHIDPRNVVVVEGFNVRRVFEIDELKEQIKAKGVLNPISVIPFRDSEGVERYRLVDGERRLRATLAAIAEGANIIRIKALYVSRSTKEEDLYIEQMMRNEGKNFSEYECGIMFQLFKCNYGYTQVEIATKFKKSTAFVSRCLSLMELPPEVQQKIETGEISVQAVRNIVAASDGNESEQIEAVTEAVSKAKSDGRKTATHKDVGGELKSKQEAKKMLKTLNLIYEKMQNIDEGWQSIDVQELCLLLQEHNNLDGAIKELYKD